MAKGGDVTGAQTRMQELSSGARIPPVTASMLIGGERVDGALRIEVRNPARPGEVVGSVVRGTPEHVDRAVAAAKSAQPAWAARTFTERASVLARALDRAGDDVPTRAGLFVRENGKTLAEARGELGDMPTRARLTLELAAELEASREMPAPFGRTFIRPIPYGVVLSIAPWNAPVSLACMQIIPALLAGNVVVVKPPESCPLALIATIELMAAVLPPGVLNTVTGLAGEIGDALTRHPDIDKICFTGSIPSARGILANAGQTIKSVTTELGGNDAAILLDDADLGADSMRRMASVILRMTGQVCMAIKRIYVLDSMHDRFVEAFRAAMDTAVVGNGLVPGVTVGPLHTRAGLERGLGLVAAARQAGAVVTELGRVDDEATFADGYFMRPMIVTDVPEDARLVAEEQFCPAIPVLRYHDLDEAVARANNSMFGLGGSVWGHDIERAAAVAARLDAGTVFVNTHGTNAVNRKAPYGGVKQSGKGRRAGLEGMMEYLQLQTLTTYEHG